MTELIAHDSVTTISAGGIAALGAKAAEDQRTSPVTARAYGHPALDGKLIVRLEPEAVAAGTDAEMAAFGFEAPKVSPKLGQVRSRTLGFPAWALVHEPKKAKAALDVTEDMRKAKRLVAAKPGHAKDAFEKIAKQLQRSAPQFLPSFWEEVGRVVADQASSTMAAQCFERARQAERAFKLKTDPEDADAAFVEFALLGALSAKTLTTYAKDLAKSAGGKEAYRRFRSIVVKRALGGMPPYSGMGKDLRALANAAKLDTATEDDALASELLEAPGVGKAPGEFWTTYREAIVRLATAKPEIRARLRAIWPEPRGGSRESQRTFTSTWVELLDEIGALADLPDDGLGGFMSRMFRYAGFNPRTEAVLRAVAPRLVQLNEKISVVTKRERWGTDLNLDLAELALELGVTLAEPEGHDDFFPESMTCDPVRVAADPHYSKKLVEAVSSMMGESEHEHRMRGKAGFESARRRWIEERIEGLGGLPLPRVKDSLESLDSKTSAETFLPFPDLLERLNTTDIASSLAFQLRAGIADEFAWPAYEEAVQQLGSTETMTGGAFPYLCVWNKTKVIAFGPTGVVAEHDFVYKPKDHSVERAIYLDGQFLVELDPTDDWRNVAYWSATPKEVFKLEQRFRMWGGNIPTAWQLPEGGVTLGNKAFRAGDTTTTGSRDFLCDGTTIWVYEHGSAEGWYVYDPIKGAKVRKEDPAFIAEYKREGWTVNHGACVMLPAPVGLTSSPLGLRDGLLGIRARSDDKNDERAAEYERIDGMRHSTTASTFALCSFPGDDVPRSIDPEGADNKRFLGGDGPGVGLAAPTGEALCTVNQDEWASRGWGDVWVPPATFWDYLVPRDEAGSRALRAITVEQARAILDAARTEVGRIGEPDGGKTSGRTLPETEAAVRGALPGIGDDKLVRGVVGHAERAAELALQLAEIASARAKENADPSGAGLAGEAAQLRKLATALAAGRAMKIADFDLDPRPWLQHGRAKAVMALSPIAEAEERRRARDVVKAMAGTILAEDLSKLRFFAIEAPDDYEDPHDWNTLVIQKHEESVFAIHASDDWALELSLDGKFRAPPPWKVGDETKLGTGIGSEWAEKFAALPDQPVAWEAAIGELIAKRADISVAEATLLYTGAPNTNRWKKDFLGKQHRDLLGLKMNEADAARTTFKELDEDELLAMIDKAAPEDPDLLHTPLAAGGFPERLGDVWKAKFGKRVKIPQDLVAAVKKDLGGRDELGKLLPLFAGDDESKLLKADLRPLPELGGWRDEEGLNPNYAEEIAKLVGWLFYARPIGCPIRAGIPRVVEKIRGVLDDPRVLFNLNSEYINAEDPKDVAKRDALLDFVGGKTIDVPRQDSDGDEDPDDKSIGGRDDGTIVALAYKNRVICGYRPAAVTAKTLEKIDRVDKMIRDYEDDDGQPDKGPLLVAQLRSDAFGEFAARVTETAVPEAGFEANPLASAPKLVAKVTKELGISDEAAVLYLQLLALAEPTQAKVQAWNGWKPKQYQAAVAELAKKKLVVEGKRERAGRAVFIKGGYTKGDRQNLPMEEWKQPFYKLLDRHIALEPCHLLFARAWKRFDDGDKPG
jgi:hypothetical protein